MTWTKREFSRQRARRAYELSRVWLGLRSAFLVLPMLGLSLVACHEPTLSVIAGVSLFLLTLGLTWRGQVYARAVVPGLLAGCVPLVLPLLLRSWGHCCLGGSCWSFCMVGCIGGGLIAGVAVGFVSAAEREQRWTFLLAATLVAGLAGLLGCALVGAAGMLGMALAVLVSSLPVAVAARLRAS